jgi:hypothetical protein
MLDSLEKARERLYGKFPVDDAGYSSSIESTKITGSKVRVCEVEKFIFLNITQASSKAISMGMKTRIT